MILYIDDWIFNITLHIIIIKAKCQRRSISKVHHQHHMKKNEMVSYNQNYTKTNIHTHAMVHVSIYKSNVNQLQFEKVNQTKFISKVHLRDIIQKNINKVVM